GERRPFRRARVAEQDVQELAQQANATALVGEEGRDVEGSRGADGDPADLDELMDRAGNQTRRHKDQGHTGPAEEGLEVEEPHAPVEADTEPNRNRQADQGAG